MSVYNERKYTEVAVKENMDDDLEKKPSSYGYGYRHVQIMLVTLSLTVSFLARSHMGVTIVAMTNVQPSDLNYNRNVTMLNGTIARRGNNSNVGWEDVDHHNLTIVDEDEIHLNAANVNNKIHASSVITYDWSKSTQEMILGSFFLGYAIMMTPMGLLCQRWGGKLPLQLCLLVSGLSTILTPWLMAWGSWKAVCACRILVGFFQAGLIPASQISISKWSNPSERAKFITYVYTGTPLGTIIAFQIAGFLGASTWGWPSIFWVVGGICLVVLVIYSIFGCSTPSEHKSISEEEKSFIMGNVEREEKKNLKVPWKAIVTSKHVWAVLATHVGSGLSFIFFFNQAPTYIRYILHMDVKKSGVLSSLPYASNIVVNFIYGVLSDFITNRKILSVKNTRIFFNSLSQIGMTVCYVTVAFTTSLEVAVVFMIIGLSCHAAIHCGWMLNHIDLTPNYAGTLMAVCNTVMCAFSVILPIVISFVVTDVNSQTQWRIMFLLMATLAFVTNAIFVLFMSAETQPWNDYGYELTETEEKPEIKTNGKVSS